MAINRPQRAKLLTPHEAAGWKFWKSNFWWPVQYRMGRVRSWQLFRLKKLGFTKRFLPGITDHSMVDYVEALNFECGYQAFTRVAIDDLKSELHGNGQASPRLNAGISKTADWAWKKFGHTRFKKALETHRDPNIRCRIDSDPKIKGEEAWDKADEEKKLTLDRARRKYGK